MSSSPAVAVAVARNNPPSASSMIRGVVVSTTIVLLLSSIPNCHADNSPIPFPYHITLPDGTNSSDVYLVGTFDDHRLADENDYTLIECNSADTGNMLCYAQQHPTTGDLISTGTTIADAPPAGLQPGEDAPLTRKEELCGQLCMDKQTEPLNDCTYLVEISSTLITNPLEFECPDSMPYIFDTNVHMSIGLSTEHAHLGLKQYFNGDESGNSANCIDAVADAEGNQGLTLQYTDLNGASQCEDYSLACGGAITDRMVQCEADGYGTITMHYNPNPTALANTICTSSPLPNDTCSYTFRVRCASECASLRRRRRLQGDKTPAPTPTPEPTKIHNLVVLFRFADHVGRTVPTIQEYQALMNDPDYSVSDVFLQASNGRLILDSDVVDWVTLDATYTEAYCAGGRSGGVPIFHECLQNALSKVDGAVDFGQFDFDLDLMIDSITFFHSGYAAEWGSPDVYGTVYSDRIWSHKWGMYPYWTSAEGVKVGKYHVNPGVWGVSGNAIGRIGVVAHETAHALGLRDRYDTSGAGNGLGSYSLMANSWGLDGSQRYPPNLSPCDKMELGWAEVVELATLGTFNLGSQCDSDVIYKVGDGKFGMPVGEFFLFENRQNCGYDILVTPGLAIYHYDSQALDVMTNDRTDPLYGKPQGYPGAEGFPADGKHYRCSLVQQDGLYELEKKENRGNAGDLFRPGQSLGPSNDPLLGPFPNSDAYQAGNITQTGIIVQVNNFFVDSTGTTGITGTDTRVNAIRRRKLQQTTPSLSFTLSGTEGSPAAAMGGDSSSGTGTVADSTSTGTSPPTGFPTETTSGRPSSVPTELKSDSPSVKPSSRPSYRTPAPSGSPSVADSSSPSGKPSELASPSPSVAGSEKPTTEASTVPTELKSDSPSVKPSSRPSYRTPEPSGSPSVADSSSPSGKPSELASPSPSVAGSEKPTTEASTDTSAVPSSSQVVTTAVSPSTSPSSSPATVLSSVPSGAPSIATTVTARAGTTITGMPTIHPSAMPSLLPDPHTTNSSVCKESTLAATDSFNLQTIMLNIQTVGEIEVTVDYKGDGDSVWNPFCHAANVVGQFPDSTLLPMSACTGLIVLSGEQVKLRMTAQPAPGTSTGSTIHRSLLGRQDIPSHYKTLESMYNYDESDCSGSSL